MKKKLNRITAAALSTLMLPVFSLPVTAEEAVVKDFNYFMSLSDYEVYVEFYNTYVVPYGKEIYYDLLPELPRYEADLPMEDMFHYSGNMFNPNDDTFFYYRTFTFEATGIDYAILDELQRNPAMFGFPEDWYEFIEAGTEYTEVDPETGEIYTDVGADKELFFAGIDFTSYGRENENQYFRICISEDFMTEEEKETVYDNGVLGLYRIILTLQNSEFVKLYAAEDGTPYFYVDELLISPSNVTVFGDLTEDDVVDSLDAAQILTNAAEAGASGVEADAAGDIDGNGNADAADAAVVLEYAAAAGTGYPSALGVYVMEKRRNA